MKKNNTKLGLIIGGVLVAAVAGLAVFSQGELFQGMFTGRLAPSSIEFTHAPWNKNPFPWTANTHSPVNLRMLNLEVTKNKTQDKYYMTNLGINVHVHPNPQGDLDKDWVSLMTCRPFQEINGKNVPLAPAATPISIRLNDYFDDESRKNAILNFTMIGYTDPNNFVAYDDPTDAPKITFKNKKANIFVRCTMKDPAQFSKIATFATVGETHPTLYRQTGSGDPVRVLPKNKVFGPLPTTEHYTYTMQ